MQTSQYRKSKTENLRRERIETYKESRQESVLCDSSYPRYSEKRFTQIYKALYEDAMLEPLGWKTEKRILKSGRSQPFRIGSRSEET